MFHKHILLLTIIFVGAFSSAQADEFSVDFSGFASLTMSYSDNPDVSFSSNYLNNSYEGFSLKNDSIFGGQANITFSQSLDAVFQFVYQDRSSQEFSDFYELGFLRYRPHRNWTFRVGRLNNDLYLLSEYPYVSYAYLWVRPPHAYYSFASTASSYDGVDVEYNQEINGGFFRAKLGLGSSDVKLKAGGEEFSITFDDSHILSAVYIKDNWTYRAAFSKASFSNFKSEPFQYLIDQLTIVEQSITGNSTIAHKFEPQDHTLDYSALGIAYDDMNWIIQAEISTVDSEWLVLPSNTTGYVSVGYRVDNMTYFTSMSVAKNNKVKAEVFPSELLTNLPETQRIQAAELIAVTEYAIHRTSVDQKSVNVGTKWYYSDRLVFKAQLDHFIIDPSGSSLWGMDESINTEQNVNLLSFSASMVF